MNLAIRMNELRESRSRGTNNNQRGLKPDRFSSAYAALKGRSSTVSAESMSFPKTCDYIA
jgi:hypothetical protein